MESAGNNEQERIYLRQTNVSTPLLREQTSSQHSVNATEDYASARTSRPSSRASNDGLLPGSPSNRFSTPPTSPPVSPSRRPRPSISADTDRTLQGQESGMTTPRGQATASQRESRIPRKPVASGVSDRASQVPYLGAPPTPGADDSPFIRFAIDQLTRDEEVRGSRQYPAAAGGLGALPGDSYIHSENRQSDGLAPDSAALGAGIETGPSSRETSGGYAPARVFDTYQAHLPDASDQIGTPAGQSYREPSISPLSEPGITHPEPAHIAQTYPTRIDSRRPAVNTQFEPELRPLSKHDVFVPVDQEIIPLKFRPAIIRLPWLGLYLFFQIWVLIGLLFSGIWPNSRQGLDAYTEFGGGRYFLFRYMPSFFGTILLLWLFQIQIALQRVAPFMAHASLSTRSRSEAPLLQYLPSNFLLPQLQYFKAFQFVLGGVMLAFWLQIFTIPLLTSMFNVYNYGGGPNDWRWTTVQGVNWTLFALFTIQTLAVLTLMIWLPFQRTGLKWDARSLADVIALLDRTNIMSDYVGSEQFKTSGQFRERLSSRTDRLGYWQASKNPEETFYTIGYEGGETRRYSLENGKIREKEHSSFPPDTPNTPRGTWESADLEHGDEYSQVRYRYLPWYMTFSVTLGYAILAMLLYIAFLVVSFVNRAVIHGFAPLTQVAPTSGGFSAANFTYSFIPAVIAQFLFLSWLSIDYGHRRLQPYVNMSNSNGRGAAATHSLLLDYTARMPISVTLDAMVNGDLKVAWYSLLTLVAASLPILAGGCFWAQFYITEQQVRISVDTSGYYALCVFLALYAFTLPSILFGLRKRRLPHACTTLAEQTSWLYQSNILSERDRRGLLGSKADLVLRISNVKTARERDILAGKEGHFVFGKFTGRDGKTHLGIERFGHDGPTEKLPGIPPTGFRQRDDSPRPGTSSRPTTPRDVSRDFSRDFSRDAPSNLGTGILTRERSRSSGIQQQSHSHPPAPAYSQYPPPPPPKDPQRTKAGLATPAIGTPFHEKVFSEIEPMPAQRTTSSNRGPSLHIGEAC